jgi:hypothetical protein
MSGTQPIAPRGRPLERVFGLGPAAHTLPTA